MELIGNPITPEYEDLKSLVLSDDFSWYYERNPKDDFHFYSHVFLERPHPDRRFPAITSPHMELANTVINQIFDYNNLDVNYIFRYNANAVHPWFYNVDTTARHVDHDFKHTNLLVYLTDAGGDTVTMDGPHTPVEDDVLLFNGEHCHRFPLRDRRVVLIVTFN